MLAISFSFFLLCGTPVDAPHGLGERSNLKEEKPQVRAPENNPCHPRGGNGAGVTPKPLAIACCRRLLLEWLHQFAFLSAACRLLRARAQATCRHPLKDNTLQKTRRVWNILFNRKKLFRSQSPPACCMSSICPSSMPGTPIEVCTYSIVPRNISLSPLPNLLIHPPGIMKSR